MPTPGVEPAIWWLDDGTGRGHVPVQFGWWIYGVRSRRWRPWRPRWARRTLDE